MTTAAVVGGGFYGAMIAVYLKTERRIGEVTLYEAGEALLERASYVNQARVHSGYHYPRSFTTAYRSRVNFPRFVRDFRNATAPFQAVYAIARRNSKVTPRQMERFCADIGAPLDVAPAEVADLFDPRLIASVYLVEEAAFDACALRELAAAALARAGVEVRLGCEVTGADHRADGVELRLREGGRSGSARAGLVFNCTYSRLQRLADGGTPLPLKHELTELALVRPPPPLRDLGVTVMDGPFFSCMPFPARGLHSLTHVRYTPHMSWVEDGARDPYALLEAHPADSRADRMIRDGARYLPALADCEVVGALMTVKTVLTQNEGDDGRPILFKRHAPHGRLISVLGGKIDNVFDVLERLDEEELPG